MREILTKYTTYMNTPLFQNREMDFTKPDPEFKGWGNKGTTLYFKIKDGPELKLEWDGYEFSGRDPRGGFSSLKVEPVQLAKFREELRSGTKVKYKEPQKVEKKANVAIVSDIVQDFGDTYYPVADMKKLVSEIFQAGYSAVYFLDFKADKNYEKSSQVAQEVSNCFFLNAEGDTHSGSALDLHQVNKLKNYMMPRHTWLRIKGRVQVNNKNFTTCCEQAANGLGLKIYAFSKSRKKNVIANESRLKNFKLVTNENKQTAEGKSQEQSSQRSQAEESTKQVETSDTQACCGRTKEPGQWINQT